MPHAYPCRIAVYFFYVADGKNFIYVCALRKKERGIAPPFVIFLSVFSTLWFGNTPDKDTAFHQPDHVRRAPALAVPYCHAEVRVMQGDTRGKRR